MSQFALASPDAATDQRIDPQVRSFLANINKDSSAFWELPQPKPQEILTGLQSQTKVDMSGVTVTQRTVSQDGRKVKLYIMKPEHVTGKPGVLLFILVVAAIAALIYFLMDHSHHAMTSPLDIPEAPAPPPVAFR